MFPLRYTRRTGDLTIKCKYTPIAYFMSGDQDGSDAKAEVGSTRSL